MKRTLPLPVLLLFLAAALFSGCATRKTTTAPAAPLERVTAGERPGLGTSWGPQRVSWVEPTAFSRANENRPDGRSAVYYNDRDGIDAMLDYLGGEPREAGGLRPAGGISYGLRDGEGRWLKAWELKGRRFVVGQLGQRYEVVLKNDSKKRVEVLVSVDGLDALDGKTAVFQKRGYVLEPHEELAVEGFRITDGTVAAFVFGRMNDTYSQRQHATTQNCGVVGVAVFREGRGQPVKDQPLPRRRSKPGENPSSRDYAKPPTDT